MGYIYKITNDINNKLYIGKTEYSNPLKRWQEHLNDYKRRKCEKRPLYAAMNKHGTEHFHFEVIEETNDATEREKYWINNLRTYIGFKDCNGYNATLGGDGKSYLNLDEDEVIRYHTECANLMATCTAKHFNVDPNTIRAVLNKHGIKYLNNAEARKVSNKKVVQLLNREVINIFNSANDAKRYLNVQTNGNKIYDACKHRIKTAYGYNWMYYDEFMNIITQSTCA